MPNYTLKIIVEGEDRASGPLKNVGSALGDIGKIAAGVGLGNLLSDGVKGLAGMARGALDSYAAYEQLGKSINSLTAKEALLTGQASTLQQAMGQTAGKSKELLDWIQKLAIESPFRQEDAAGAFRLSLAFGFSTREAQRLTAAMVDFTTATGASGETIERISRALGQIKTRGKLSMEELNQLAEGGVDALRILSDATGKTGKDLMDAITKGQIDANFAIQAILKDMERMYAGAGKSAATSMSGLLSTLSEIKDTVGRDLLGGVFQSFQAPLAGLTTILTAPEFRAGVQQWGATLGQFSSDRISETAAAFERINSVIQPLLSAQAPPWMVALGVLAGAGSTEVVVNPKLPEGYQPLKVPTSADTTPKLTDGFEPLFVPTDAKVVKAALDPTKDYGLTIVSTAKATTAYLDLQDEETGEGGKFKIDSVAGITAWKWNASGVGLTWDASKGFTIAADLGIGNVKPIEITTNITPENKKIIDAILAAGEKGGAKGFGTELANQTKIELQKEVDAVAAVAGGWAATIKSNLDSEFKAWEPVIGAVGSWVGDTPAKLFGQLQQPFKEPVMVVASWAGDVLTGLWDKVQQQFDNNPIRLFFNPPKVGTGNPYVAPARNGTYTDPVSGGQMPIVPYINPYAIPGGATGFQNFKGGLAVVGEEGPELVRLPAGADVFSNPDSVKMLSAMGIPGFADGTTQLPPGAGPIISLLGSLGLWVPQRQQQMGPLTKEQSVGWRDFTNQGVQAMQTAADRTGAAFEDTAKKVNGAFESALQGVPGLFGTSQVTGDQMRLAELGVPQNFADDYLRRLSDEVLNGVDWEGVDIGDAASRAGIDPNLPAEVILELFKKSWNDSSLFANAGNLDLINQDAVKAAIEQQQKELEGQANIKALFGITDENLQKQSEELGAGLAAVFGGAADTDAVKGAGATVFEGIGKGLSDTGVASKNVAGMADAMKTAIGTPENQSALYDNGYAAYAPWAKGFAAAAAAAPITPPGGGSGSGSGGTPPAGNALGTPSWRGGWTVAGEYGPELLNLPGGTSIYDAPTTQRMRRGGIRPMVVNQTFVVNDKLMAEQAAQRAVQMIKRGGR